MPISGVHTGGVATRIPRIVPQQANNNKIYEYVMEIGGGSPTTFLRSSKEFPAQEPEFTLPIAG